MIAPNNRFSKIHRDTERVCVRPDVVALDRNEQVNPLPEMIFKDMIRHLGPAVFSRYPDTVPFYAALTRQLGIPTNHLYVTPGSDAALRMVFQSLLSPGDRILTADPTYAMVQVYAQIFQADAECVSYSESLKIPIERWLSSLDRKPRLMVLANPDQPTGAVISLEDLRILAQKTHDIGAYFVVDEAYYPFSEVTILPLLKEFDHLIMIRSFSKAAGLAGLRLGFAAAHPSIIECMNKVRGAHEVSAVAVIMGQYMVEHPELIRRQMEMISDGRRILLDRLSGKGILCPPCVGNFQLIRFPGLTDTIELVGKLESKGYLVKGKFTHPALLDCIRVTLANDETMVGFVTALESCLKEIGWN